MAALLERASRWRVTPPHDAYLRVSTHEPRCGENQTDILLLAHRQQLGQVQLSKTPSRVVSRASPQDCTGARHP